MAVAAARATMHVRRAAEEALVSTMDGRDLASRETALPPEGDDISVLPGAPPDGRGRRRRSFLVALAVFALASAAAVAALAAHTRGSRATVVQTRPAVATAPTATVARSIPKVVAKPPAVAPVGPALSVAPSTAAHPRNTLPSLIQLPPATAAAPTTAPPVPQFGPSVLAWTAPRSLTMAAGTTATVSVVAHNPTVGVVTLAHPLSCAPRLDHSEMCTENVQLIGPGQSASATYAIDAHGIAPGHDTLVVEGVLTIDVTVT